MTESVIKPSPRMAEQFEIMKCRLLTMLNGQANGPAVVAFTSCKSGEGVSSVAANFAATLGEDTNRRVLLMDGDLRRPSLHRVFPRRYLKKLNNEMLKEEKKGTTNEPALIQGYSVPAKKGKELAQPAWKMIRTTSNLDVLLARRRVADPGELFQMQEFADFLAYAREKYDFIVLDCPPVYGGSGSTILSSKADAVIMVVEAGRVRRQSVSRAINLLEDTGARVLGVVLNKRRFPIPKLFYRML